MNVIVEVEIETRIVDAATGNVVKQQKQKNLVLDCGLNGMAKNNSLGLSCGGPAPLNTYCLIGSGNTANSLASGGTTFTQSGTTITASGNFFTSNMVGAIFKYGTGSGGAEYYITAFTDATHVTVNTSATVGTPTVATIWFVARTTLDSLLFTSNTYSTGAGDCGTSFSSNQVTHKKTIKFAQQASPYTVNEVGYAPANVSSRVAGRVVLSSSDTVGTSNFYVVAISITVTYTPATPTSVPNVGTNINTAGTIAIECFAINIVNSDGSNGNIANAYLESGAPNLVFITNSYTQNAAPSSSNTTVGASMTAIGATGSWVNNASVVGQQTITFTNSISTSGQTFTGIGLGVSGFSLPLDVKFTTPVTAPTGTFQPNTVWSLTYTRTLVN